MMGRRRRPRYRRFKPSLASKAPALMLVIGLVVSAGAHVGLGYALKDRSFGNFDPAAFEDDTPVRVKRAQFDEIKNDRSQISQAEATAEDLADELMDEVKTVEADPFAPDLEMRDIEEHRPPAPLDAGLDSSDLMLDTLLSGMVPEPEDMEFVDSTAFDASREPGPGSAQMSGELLAMLSAPEGGLPSIGEVGGAPGGGTSFGKSSGTGDGEGPSLASAPGTGTGTGLGMGNGPGGGVDFFSLGEIDPGDFEPPQRLDEDFDYNVTRFDPPTGFNSKPAPRGASNVTRPSDADQDGYFRVQIDGRRSLKKLATMPKDVIFMIDTSRSIPQKYIEEIFGGVVDSLRTFNENDRFNLVLFSEQTYFFEAQPVLATRDNVDRVEKWVKGVRSRGYTDVNLAIRQMLKRDLDPGKVYELVLISDGKPTLGVLDTRELINLITRENDLNASIYCVGIGRDQDNRLLDFLAYRNKGFSVGVKTRQDMAATIRNLLSRLRYPIITDVRVRFAGTGLEEVYPILLPNVHQGESFEIYGRYDKPGPFTMQVSGISAGQRVDFTFRSDLTDAPLVGDEVATGWAFWKLHHLYSEIIRVGEQAELLEQIRELRQRYDLNTLY